MLWLLSLAVVFLYLVQRKTKRSRIFAKQFRNDLASVPILGHAYHFIGSEDNRHRFSVVEKFGKEALKQGGVTYSWILQRLYLIVADAVVADIIMRKCLEKNDAMKKNLRLLGNSSVVVELPIWRLRRKILEPTFNRKNLSHYVEIFSKNSKILVNQLENRLGSDISIFEYIKSYVFDSVCETALGIVSNSHEDPTTLDALMKCSELISDRMVKPWLHVELIYKLTPFYAEFVRNSNILYNSINSAIRTQRKEVEKPNYIEDEDGDYLKPLLERILETPKGRKTFTNEELKEELAGLFLAALGTTTIGTSSAISLMARHPDVQEKVFKELCEVLGDSDCPILAEDLPRLKYLDAVIRESLRMYPPGPVILRDIKQDLTLPSGEIIPQGTGVFLHIYAIHRNPVYWGDDAETFRPERFLNNEGRHPAAFLAFSHGPRSCVGYQHAMMVMKTVVATLVRRYHVLPISPTHFGKPFTMKFDIFLRDVDDFQLVLKPRM